MLSPRQSIFSLFQSPHSLTYRDMIRPNDGLYLQEVLIKDKKKKNSNSKVFEFIIKCLECGKHDHMLRYREKDKTEFEVRMVNKKSPKWIEEDISLFVDLDLLFKKDFRLLDGRSYDEKTKVRFKSRMIKLSRYVKEQEQNKISKVETWKIYKILKRPVLGENKSDSKKNLRSLKNRIENKMDILGSLDAKEVNGLEEDFISSDQNVMQNMDILGSLDAKEVNGLEEDFISSDQNVMRNMDILGGLDAKEVNGLEEDFISSDQNVMRNDSSYKLGSTNINGFTSDMWFGPITHKYTVDASTFQDSLDSLMEKEKVFLDLDTNAKFEDWINKFQQFDQENLEI